MQSERTLRRKIKKELDSLQMLHSNSDSIEVEKIADTSHYFLPKKKGTFSTSPTEPYIVTYTLQLYYNSASSSYIYICTYIQTFPN